MENAQVWVGLNRFRSSKGDQDGVCESKTRQRRDGHEGSLMNRYREDTPYTFRPPKYSPFWAAWICCFNDVYWLKRINKITEIRVTGGGEGLVARYRKGDALLVTPNHSDHADPHVLMHLSRRYRVPLHFMAARETFEKSGGLEGVVMQRAGCFSIDREGSDLRAIKEAIRLLTDARYPLVMFPEGEIYHVNRQLTPLNQGAATLALRAARKVLKDGGDRRAYIVPTAMRYRYIDDISATFESRMARLEGRIQWAPQSHLDIVARIYKFGEALLTLKEIEFLGSPQTGDLSDRLQQFRETLIVAEEERYFQSVSREDHPSRVRRLRGKIRTVLLAEELPSQGVIDDCYRSLDRVYVSLQSYSYPSRYLRGDSEPGRLAETIHKFEEDVLGENEIKGRRRAEVTFCDPIDLSDYAAAGAKRSVGEVTERIQQAIQDVLDAS